MLKGQICYTEMTNLIKFTIIVREASKQHAIFLHELQSVLKLTMGIWESVTLFKHEGVNSCILLCIIFLEYAIIKRGKGTLYVSCNYRERLRFLAFICEVKPGGWKRALATRILLAKKKPKPMKLQWNFPQELDPHLPASVTIVTSQDPFVS